MKKEPRQEKDNSVAYRIYLPKGFLKFPDGQKIELYSIGVIADVLARDWREIRDWEFRGLIPLSPFCDAFGRRLYTKDMIRTIVRCAEEYKIPVKKRSCNATFSRKAFFINLTVRLERLYRVYEARLEIKLPAEYEDRNKKFIRKYVLQSPSYKEYLLNKEKGREKSEADKELEHRRRSERFWERWRRDPAFRKSVYEYFIRREKYYERIGNYEAAERIRQGRRKYYDENGVCLIDCNEKL